MPDSSQCIALSNETLFGPFLRKIEQLYSNLNFFLTKNAFIHRAEATNSDQHGWRESIGSLIKRSV